MIRIDDHTNINLDTLAEQHYNNRIGNVLVDGVNYHATQSLIGRIRVQRAQDAVIPNQTRLDFWDYLLNDDFRNLKRVITSRPDTLKVIIGEIEDICGAGFFSNDIDFERATLTDFGVIVRNVFNYDAYRNGAQCSANCQQLNLSYCPYCNEQTIQVIEDINGLDGDVRERALLQLDHFYPQSRHPYFAVSFFNLIPGCAVCNAQLKGEKKFDIDSHFNPFHKRLDDFFSFQIDSLLLQSENDVIINHINKAPHLDNALTDFTILNRYQNIAHKRTVFKLFQSFKNHSSKINRSIAQQFQGLFINESKRRVLLEKYNVPVNQNEINQVHLGKLKRDIVIQMKVLNP